jgi:hypothetical protein
MCIKREASAMPKEPVAVNSSAIWPNGSAKDVTGSVNAQLWLCLPASFLA